MRYLCLVAVLLALPLTAGAQQKRAEDRQSDRNRSEQRRSDDRRADDKSSSPRTPAWERQQLPAWERQQTPAWEKKQTPAWEKKQTPAWELKQIPGWENGNVARALLNQQRNPTPPNTNNHRRPRQYQPSIVYVLPQYRYFPESLPTTTQFVVTPPPPTAPVAVAPPPPPAAPMGALRLEVEPRESLQIFVDGVYVGTPADLGDELELAPGTRRIELRARGHRALTFNAEIVDGRSITYRGSLDREEVSATPATPPQSSPAPKPVVVPAGSNVMYMIPGCYLGNVSPKNVTLRPGCDINKLRTISP